MIPERRLLKRDAVAAGHRQALGTCVVRVLPGRLVHWGRRSDPLLCVV